MHGVTGSSFTLCLDFSPHPYYRRFDSLPDNLSLDGPCKHPSYIGFPCIYKEYAFGWAVTGVLDRSRRESVPVTLSVSSWDEPDVTLGLPPKRLKATVHVRQLNPGTNYTLYRWDSVESAFDYSQVNASTRFQPTADTFDFIDPMYIASDTAVYYRVLKQ